MFLKELLGIRIVNFVKFEILLHLKLYGLLILKKIQKTLKNNILKALKTNKLVLFPIYCLVNKTVPNTHYLRRHDQSNHLVASMAAALNWSGNAVIGGGGGGSTLGRRHQLVAQCCSSIQPSFRSIHCMFGLFLDSYKC